MKKTIQIEASTKIIKSLQRKLKREQDIKEKLKKQTKFNVNNLSDLDLAEFIPEIPENEKFTHPHELFKPKATVKQEPIKLTDDKDLDELQSKIAIPDLSVHKSNIHHNIQNDKNFVNSADIQVLRTKIMELEKKNKYLQNKLKNTSKYPYEKSDKKQTIKPYTLKKPIIPIRNNFISNDNSKNSCKEPSKDDKSSIKHVNEKIVNKEPGKPKILVKTDIESVNSVKSNLSINLEKILKHKKILNSENVPESVLVDIYRFGNKFNIKKI